MHKCEKLSFCRWTEAAEIVRARDEELRRMFDRVVAAKEKARAKRLELEEQTDFLEREKGRRIHILRPLRGRGSEIWVLKS